MPPACRVDIFGHSLGSIIAQTFGECRPERTARKVLLCSSGGQPPHRERKAARFDGLGHDPFRENPPAVAEIINRFLAG